jgi:hypothetical protein
MPRTSAIELEALLTTGVAKPSMTIQRTAKFRIIKLAAGLLHYAYLLALHACLAAVHSKNGNGV